MEGDKVVFIGYSGHSYGCIELAIDNGFKVVGYHDISEKQNNPYNLKYMGTENNFDVNIKPFISIGNNSKRREIYNKLKLMKASLDISLIHLNAVISKSSIISDQTYINAGVIINPQVKIGIGCIINTGSVIEHDCKIGEFSHIAPGSVLAGNVSIGNRCMIGANSVIKEGIEIGDDITIGAGSVVVNDIKNPGIYIGSPCKFLKNNK